MTEEWRPVQGIEGYEVSDLGRVRSWVRRGSHGGAETAPRILSPGKAPNGYRRLSLSQGGNRVYRSVHRLVAEVFAGGYEVGLIVCHNDSNKENNRASNLRWDTISSNSIDASRLGDIPRQVLNEEQVRQIRDLYQAGGHSHRSLSEDFGITPQAIRDLLIRKNYRWVA